jgi:hypothetical protein
MAAACCKLVSCSAVFLHWRWTLYVIPKRQNTYGLHGALQLFKLLLFISSYLRFWTDMTETMQMGWSKFCYLLDGVWRTSGLGSSTRQPFWPKERPWAWTGRERERERERRIRRIRRDGPIRTLRSLSCCWADAEFCPLPLLVPYTCCFR